MPKKFLSNVALLLTVNLLIKPFWILGIDRTVQNTVGHEAYGAYINLFTLSLLFTMLLDFGINNYTSTFIARHRQLLDKTFGSLLPLKLLFALAYLLLTTACALAYGIRGHNLLLLIWLACNQVMAFFILFFRANISGLQLFRTDSLLSVSDRGMMILFALLLFFGLKGHFRIEHFVMAQSAGYLVSLFISFFALKPHLKNVKPVFRSAMMYSLVKQSWPYALLALLMTLYTRIDYLLIKKLLPDGDLQNGIYAVANRLFEAANMLAVLVASMLLPMFASMLRKQEDLSQLLRTSMVLLLVPAVGAASVSWFYAHEIMSLISTHNPAASAGVFRYVMISFAAMCVMYIYGTLLTAGSRLQTLNILAAIAIVLNLVLNLLLIPMQGAKGAAISALCTHGFIAASNTFFALRYYRPGISQGFFWRFFLLVLTIPACVYGCRLYNLPLATSVLSTAVAALALLAVTRLVTVKQLASMVKRS